MVSTTTAGQMKGGQVSTTLPLLLLAVLCARVTTVSPEPRESAPACPPTPTCGIFEEGITKAFPPDCTKFIVCSLAVATIKSCPPDKQHFSPVASQCTNPEEARCPLCLGVSATSPLTPEVTEVTTEAGTTETLAQCPDTPSCGASETGVTKPFPPDCTKYVYCNELAQGEVRLCPRFNPDEKHYSADMMRCTSLELANCPLCQVM